MNINGQQVRLLFVIRGMLVVVVFLDSHTFRGRVTVTRKIGLLLLLEYGTDIACTPSWVLRIWTQLQYMEMAT